MTDLDELSRLLEQANAPRPMGNRLEWVYAQEAVSVALRNHAEALIRDARRYQELLSAARHAVVALAHASEAMPRYDRDYRALSDALDAIAQEQP